MPARSLSRDVVAGHRAGDADWRLWWIERGRGRLRTPVLTQPVREGDLLLFCGGAPVTLLWSGHKPLAHEIALPLAWIEEWKLPPRFFEAIARGAPVRCPTAEAGLTALATRLRHDPASNRPIRQRAIIYELRALVWHLADWFEQHDAGNISLTATPTRQTALAVRLMQTLVSDLSRPFSPAAVAHAVGVSPAHASAIFRQSHGCTMREFLARQRIQKAQELLAETDLKIVDVALASGFNTPSRFYAAFERFCGLPPSSYRAAPPLRPGTSRHADFGGNTARPALPHRDESHAVAPSRSPARSCARVILWVDDLPSNNTHERFLLLARGIACEACLDNASARTLLNEYFFVAVITDLTRFNRPETGWETVALVRQRQPKLPIFIYTDRVTPRLSARARRAGATAIHCRSRELVEAICASVLTPAAKKTGD